LAPTATPIIKAGLTVCWKKDNSGVPGMLDLTRQSIDLTRQIGKSVGPLAGWHLQVIVYNRKKIGGNAMHGGPRPKGALWGTGGQR
jgi:hypothetical protein